MIVNAHVAQRVLAGKTAVVRMPAAAPPGSVAPVRRCYLRVGHAYPVKTHRDDKTVAVRAAVIAVERQRIGEITDRDARREGYRDLRHLHRLWLASTNRLLRPPVADLLSRLNAAPRPLEHRLIHPGQRDELVRGGLLALAYRGFARRTPGGWVITTAGQIAHLNPLHALDGTEVVWTVRVGPEDLLDTTRLLARIDRDVDPDQIDDHGYTDRADLALVDEAEAVPAPGRIVEQSRALHNALHQANHDDRLAELTPEDRYRALREMAAARGINVRDDERLIQSRLDRMEEKIRRHAA